MPAPRGPNLSPCLDAQVSYAAGPVGESELQTEPKRSGRDYGKLGRTRQRQPVWPSGDARPVLSDFYISRDPGNLGFYKKYLEF